MIVITGANGFIGSALAWDCNNRGRKDLLCVDSISIEDRPGLLSRRQYLSLMDADDFLAYLGGSEAQKEIEIIVHMGACSDTTEMNRDYLRRNNTEYTQKLFTWCTQHQRPIIYASSGATYGLGELGFSDAVDPQLLRPLNPYGESKIAFDRWAVRQEKVPPVWFGLRFFNVYGPNEYHKGAMSSVVCKAFEQIRKTGALQLFRSNNASFEDGKQMRDFVYVKDITSWIWQLLNAINTGRSLGSSAAPVLYSSGIYNMGYGQARTWLDLAQAVFNQMQVPLSIHWIEMPPSLRDQYQYFTEARMERLFAIGLQSPAWSLESGIRDYLKNYLLTEDPYL
jgi:ADP-L-glycero-D-manno-heptose 6-epimerase